MAKRRKQKHVPEKKRLKVICHDLWRHAIYNDWDHRCAVCGNQKVDAHHLVPCSFEATRYNLNNGIALCSHHHIFDDKLAPHKNAGAWLEWLQTNHPHRYGWWMENLHPKFNGTTDIDYYCGVVRGFRAYFEPMEFEAIVGIRFNQWLETEGN